MKVLVLEPAIRHIDDAAKFYELQARGVGDHFRRSILKDIKRLSITGGVHELAYGRFHRAIARHFPFGIYYKLDGNTVVVYGIIDSRRDPEWIGGQLI